MNSIAALVNTYLQYMSKSTVSNALRFTLSKHIGAAGLQNTPASSLCIICYGVRLTIAIAEAIAYFSTIY